MSAEKPPAEIFDLYFGDRDPPPDEEGYVHLLGRIVIGDWWETICAPASFWGRADYKRQWARSSAYGLQARKPFGLIVGALYKRCFNTWMFVPGAECWRAHEILCFPDAVWTGRFVSLLPSSLEEVAADCEGVSTWFVTEAALREWHGRLTPTANVRRNET